MSIRTSRASFLDSLGRITIDDSLWIAAIALFGVGDLVTTVYFIVEFGAVESHPIVAAGLEAAGGLWILAPWKGAAIAVFYGMYRITPDSMAIGVPLGLALLGAVLTVWNVIISITGSAPI